MTRPGWCSNTSMTPTCVPGESPRESSLWVHGSLYTCILPTAAVPWAGDRSVSPPAGEQDKNPQTAGRAGGDAEWVSQPCTQGPLQDQGWAQRGTRVSFCPGLFYSECLWLLRFKLSENLFPFITDLVDFYEMLRLPSERQHYKTGCSLVYSVFWVRDFLHTVFDITSCTTSTLLYIMIVCFRHVKWRPLWQLSHHYFPAS